MIRLLKISISILLLILIFGGYTVHQTSKKHDFLLDNMKAQIDAAMMYLNDSLSIFSKENTIDLPYKVYGDVYQSVGVVENESMVLASSSLLTAEERKTLSNLSKVLRNLKGFLNQISMYYEREEPFSLGACERVYLETEQDIIDELESFREILYYTESIDNEERWGDLIRNFDGNGKMLCESWKSPLL